MPQTFLWFDFSAPLFWYKLIFATELMVAEGFATYTLKKRSRFALRVALCVLGIYAIAFLFPVFFASPVLNTVTASVMFLSLFAVTICALKICYDEKLVTLFFCGVVAYTTQHLAYSIYNFLTDTMGVRLDPYGPATAGKGDVYPFAYLCYFGSYAVVYWFVWAFVEHKIREQEKLRIEPLLLGSFAAILFVDVILSLIVTYMIGEITKLQKLVLFLYEFSSCMFVYIVLYSVLGKRLAEAELETVESLWRQDRKNFEMSRENVEIINVKCHDLKHQIRKLRSAPGGVIDESYLSELEKSVMIYNNTVKTGNEALDLIFAENSIVMAKHKIKLSVLAEGEMLSFLPDADVYSLFGNALHNAMEAVIKTDDEEKRVIRIRVHREGRMAVVHFENYCNEVTFGEDGLPRTDKREKGHGYGMRSMKLIAEKHGGFLSAEKEGELFLLTVVLPIPTKEEEKRE